MTPGENFSAAGDEIAKQAKKYALNALLLWLPQGIPIAIALLFKIRILLLLSVLFMHWGFPFLVAFVFEKRGTRSLGLVFRRQEIARYLLYALAGFVLITILHWGELFARVHWAGESLNTPGTSTSLLMAIVMQLVMVGLPEEILYRGFFMTRLCEWLGKSGGLFCSAVMFGFVHTFSRVLGQGEGYIISALIIGFSTFVGGLIFGFQFLKTRSIFPSALTHIVLNLSLVPIVH